MNLPNCITLSRIPLMILVVWLMEQRWTGAALTALLVYVVAALGDWLDGYLARKNRNVSVFGKFMDALTDKIFVLGILIAFVEGQVVSIYWVLPVLCREFLVSGMRMMAAAKGVVIAAERGGKTKTLVQMISIGMLLGAPVLSRDFPAWLDDSFLGRGWDVWAGWLHWAGWLLFVFSVWLTVRSGLEYITKYRRMIFEDGV
ncbi:MAG: CDP-diacylglycerol--glycerol-3-phosphate 3-phosphatidyltransferase [Opitutaceae bacterium]|jgi:CDP-diacylglycerol--glycerol-3-phosphate 3-phosphatidyltransferase|nr:CDP-diacylglycerol--glycerol-3-phosphate 3-phosphatidyltransferase [Opitutaceae bacterium]